MSRDMFESQLRAFFDARGEGIVCVYLFGSLARGEERFDDIDIAVLYEHEQPASIESPHFVLARDLERALKKAVDLIDLERAPPDLVHRVLRDGRLIVERDASRRVAFEVKARNEYFDLEPVRNEYRRMGGARP